MKNRSIFLILIKTLILLGLLFNLLNVEASYRGDVCINNASSCESNFEKNNGIYSLNSCKICNLDDMEEYALWHKYKTEPYMDNLGKCEEELEDNQNEAGNRTGCFKFDDSNGDFTNKYGYFICNSGSEGECSLEMLVEGINSDGEGLDLGQEDESESEDEIIEGTNIEISSKYLKWQDTVIYENIFHKWEYKFAFYDPDPEVESGEEWLRIFYRRTHTNPDKIVLSPEIFPEDGGFENMTLINTDFKPLNDGYCTKYFNIYEGHVNKEFLEGENEDKKFINYKKFFIKSNGDLLIKQKIWFYNNTSQISTHGTLNKNLNIYKTSPKLGYNYSYKYNSDYKTHIVPNTRIYRDSGLNGYVDLFSFKTIDGLKGFKDLYDPERIFNTYGYEKKEYVYLNYGGGGGVGSLIDLDERRTKIFVPPGTISMKGGIDNQYSANAGVKVVGSSDNPPININDEGKLNYSKSLGKVLSGEYEYISQATSELRMFNGCPNSGVGQSCGEEDLRLEQGRWLYQYAYTNKETFHLFRNVFNVKVDKEMYKKWYDSGCFDGNGNIIPGNKCGVVGGETVVIEGTENVEPSGGGDEGSNNNNTPNKTYTFVSNGCYEVKEGGVFKGYLSHDCSVYGPCNPFDTLPACNTEKITLNDIIMEDEYSINDKFELNINGTKIESKYRMITGGGKYMGLIITGNEDNIIIIKKGNNNRGLLAILKNGKYEYTTFDLSKFLDYEVTMKDLGNLLVTPVAGSELLNKIKDYFE